MNKNKLNELKQEYIDIAETVLTSDKNFREDNPMVTVLGVLKNPLDK